MNKKLKDIYNALTSKSVSKAVFIGNSVGIASGPYRFKIKEIKIEKDFVYFIPKPHYTKKNFKQRWGEKNYITSWNKRYVKRNEIKVNRVLKQFNITGYKVKTYADGSVRIYLK